MHIGSITRATRAGGMSRQPDAVDAGSQEMFVVLMWVRLRACFEISGRLPWGVFRISRSRNKHGSRNVLIPPCKKVRRCFLCLRGSVGLKKVNNELIELLVIEPIIVAHPVGSICEGKVKLGAHELGKEMNRVAYLYCRICNSTRGNTPIHPMLHCIILSFRRACSSRFMSLHVVFWYVIAILC